jgi:hypothetical protein
MWNRISILRKLVRIGVGILVLAVLGVGCSGGGSETSTRPQHSAESVAKTVTTTTTTLSALPPSTTTPTVPSGTAPCSASQLTLALARDLGSAMQQPAAFFSLTNGSSSPCATAGYPTLTLYDTGGRELAVDIRPGSTFQIIDPGPHVIAIQPGQSVYFGLGYALFNRDAAGNENMVGCTHSGSGTAVLPNTDTAVSAVAQLSLPVCPVGGSVTAIAAAGAFMPATPVPTT